MVSNSKLLSENDTVLIPRVDLCPTFLCIIHFRTKTQIQNCNSRYQFITHITDIIYNKSAYSSISLSRKKKTSLSDSLGNHVFYAPKLPININKKNIKFLPQILVCSKDLVCPHHPRMIIVKDFVSMHESYVKMCVFVMRFQGSVFGIE